MFFLVFRHRPLVVRTLELVNVIVEIWEFNFETLSLTDFGDKDVSLGTGFQWVRFEGFPMVEDALWEGLTGSEGTEMCGETEGFSDWQVGLDLLEWGTSDLVFFLDGTTTGGQALVDTTGGISWGGNFSKEDWLEESWLSGVVGGIEDSSGGWDNLTTTTMDSISMEDNVHNVEFDLSQVLFSKDGFLGDPLETRFHGVLDFVEVLNSLGGIAKDVWTTVVWTEGPDLLGLSTVPTEFFGEDLNSFLRVALWTDSSFFDVFSDGFVEWFSNAVETVVLVW